jgi:hypothetical protein
VDVGIDKPRALEIVDPVVGHPGATLGVRITAFPPGVRLEVIAGLPGGGESDQLVPRLGEVTTNEVGEVATRLQIPDPLVFYPAQGPSRYPCIYISARDPGNKRLAASSYLAMAR